MAVMMGNLYSALRAGNVPEDKARAAAEEAAGYETRLTRIEAIVTMHTWMLGVVIAGIIAVVAMDVQILLRLPHA
jgi:hypothetical protein